MSGEVHALALVIAAVLVADGHRAIVEVGDRMIGDRRLLLRAVDRAPALAARSQTLTQMENFAAKLRSKSGVGIEPMQLAALLLERIASAISDDDLDELLTLPLTERKAAG